MSVELVLLSVIGTWMLMAGICLGYRGHPPPWRWPEDVKNDQEGVGIVLCLFWPIGILISLLWLLMVLVGSVTMLPGQALRRLVDWCRQWRQRRAERARQNFLAWDQEEE